MTRKLNVNDADMLASKFRREVLGCSLADPIRVKAMLLKLNILTVYRPLSEKFCGISLLSKDGDRFMLINSNTKRGRQHYTIAHELYHLYYDENPKPHICTEEETKDLLEIKSFQEERKAQEERMQERLKFARRWQNSRKPLKAPGICLEGLKMPLQ